MKKIVKVTGTDKQGNAVSMEITFKPVRPKKWHYGNGYGLKVKIPHKKAEYVDCSNKKLNIDDLIQEVITNKFGENVTIEVKKREYNYWELEWGLNRVEQTLLAITMGGLIALLALFPVALYKLTEDFYASAKAEQTNSCQCVECQCNTELSNEEEYDVYIDSDTVID